MRAERRPERVSSQTPASPGTTCGVGGLALDICSSDLRGLGVGEAGGGGQRSASCARAQKCGRNRAPAQQKCSLGGRPRNAMPLARR